VIPVSELPDRSRKTHPTQIYSAINAALLFAFLWFYYPWRRSDGEVFALMLVLYSVGRFLLEIVRRDEAGQFGTVLTISQWISVIVLTIGLGLLLWVRLRPIHTG
jgi:phosphatidylglycerol:prolipoprotein diacylglycerol transferase